MRGRKINIEIDAWICMYVWIDECWLTPCCTAPIRWAIDADYQLGDLVIAIPLVSYTEPFHGNVCLFPEGVKKVINHTALFLILYMITCLHDYNNTYMQSCIIHT